MENKYLKDRISIPDNEARNWDIISYSTLCKENLKEKISEKEIIESYVHSIECLFNAFEFEKNISPGIIVFRTNQVIFPLLYSCRHSIELSLKYYFNKMNLQKISGHKLIKIFNNIPQESRKKLEKYKELIESMDLLDNDGCKFRYSTDSKGQKYNDNPQFVNTKLIIKDTIQFCKKIISEIY